MNPTFLIIGATPTRCDSTFIFNAPPPALGF
jgi:hypothetical protein